MHMYMCAHTHTHTPHLVLKSAHDDAVLGKLTHVHCAQLPDLSSNTVLLHQRLLDTGGRPDTV